MIFSLVCNAQRGFSVQDTLVRAFEQYFGLKPTYITRAPGRVNLIGDHTDYNDGFVLPMAIDRHVWVAARPREDGMINLYSLNYESIVSFSTDKLKHQDQPHWTEHLRGVWYLLGERAQRPPGVDIMIHGDVPIGAGLSSSAAIEVALIELALKLIDRTMTQKEKALFGVDVENTFVGVPSGVMDQLASALSKRGSALLIDCRSLETEPVDIPSRAVVAVIDSAKRRQLTEGGYAVRREECEEAARIMGVSHLRDATRDILMIHKDKMPANVFRRARHVVTENERVLLAVGALKSGNLIRMGELMNESHYSMRDDFENSVPELDRLTSIARKVPGCYGARMTGGGFGGAAVALVERRALDTFIDIVSDQYAEQVGLQASAYAFEPAGGSEVIFEAASHGN
jgi:galactokinase